MKTTLLFLMGCMVAGVTFNPTGYLFHGRERDVYVLAVRGQIRSAGDGTKQVSSDRVLILDTENAFKWMVGYWCEPNDMGMNLVDYHVWWRCADPNAIARTAAEPNLPVEPNEPAVSTMDVYYVAGSGVFHTHRYCFYIAEKEVVTADLMAVLLAKRLCSNCERIDSVE